MNSMFKQLSRKFCTAAAHVPVMSKEVLHFLKPDVNQVILDMTFGAGGHSRRILESAPGIKLH